MSLAKVFKLTAFSKGEKADPNPFLLLGFMYQGTNQPHGFNQDLK